jgi:hypothetical protein
VIWLQLARNWYGLVGGVTLLMTAGHVWGALAGGSRLDPPVVAGGLGVGALALVAAIWVPTEDRLKSAAVWLGIVGVAVGCLIALWIAVTSAGTDAVIFVGIPTLVALAAAARMAVAAAGGRARGRAP